MKEDLDGVPLEKKHYLAFQKPFYAFNLLRASRKYTREDLLSFLDMLAHFDAKVKKGTRHDRTNFEAGFLRCKCSGERSCTSSCLYSRSSLPFGWEGACTALRS